MVGYATDLEILKRALFNLISSDYNIYFSLQYS